MNLISPPGIVFVLNECVVFKSKKVMRGWRVGQAPVIGVI